MTIIRDNDQPCPCTLEVNQFEHSGEGLAGWMSAGPEGYGRTSIAGPIAKLDCEKCYGRGWYDPREDRPLETRTTVDDDGTIVIGVSA